MLCGGGNLNYNNSASSGLSALAQTQSQVQPNISNPITQPKYVSFGAKEEVQKDGISNGAKWGIGLGLAALAGAGIYIATKGKAHLKPENNISKILKEKLVATDFSAKLEYKPATSLDEARKYAVDVLKIKEVDQAIPLEVLNKLNSEFVDVINANKGHLLMPKALRYIKMTGENELTGALVRGNPLDKDFLEMHINSSFYDKDSLIRILKENSMFADDGTQVFVFKESTKICPVVDGVSIVPDEQIEKLMKKFYASSETMPLSELRMLHAAVSEGGQYTTFIRTNPMRILEDLEKGNKSLNINLNTLKNMTLEEQTKELQKILESVNCVHLLKIQEEVPHVYHEMGHLQDDYKNMLTQCFGSDKWKSRHCKREELMELFDNDTDYKYIQHHYPDFMDFINNKETQYTAGKVSWYAQEGIGEFIAETYAKMIKGVKLDDDVMALYKKYDGPMIVGY